MINLIAANIVSGVAGTATAITYTISGMEKTTSDTYKILAQGQLPSSVGTLYTVPALTTAFVKNIMLCNTTGSQVTGIKIFLNGTAASNQIFLAVLNANCTAIYDQTGWKIYDATGTINVAFGGGTYQPLDADLTVIAGLTATTDNFMQSKSNAWASRTPAQVKSDLGINDKTSFGITYAISKGCYLP